MNPTVARVQHIELAMIHALVSCVIGLPQATSGYIPKANQLRQ